MQNRSYSKSKPSRGGNKRLIIIFSVILVCVLAVALYLKFHHSYKVIPATSPSEVSAITTMPSTASTSPDKTQGSTSSTAETGSQSSTAELKAPSGTFVSNHSPALNNSEIPSSEQSVCNTTPGVTCSIQFVKGSSTQSLEAKTADSEGNVYWNWDVKTAGLTVGKWKITAIAKSGDKTLTTTDQLELDVQP